MSTVNHHTSSPTADVTMRARGVACSVVEMAELHAGLFAADYQDARRQAVPSLVLIVASAITALASLPLVLGGIAVMLSIYTPLALWGSLLLVGCIVTIVALAVGYSAINKAKNALKVFERSQGELKLNLAWLKSLLR